MIIMDEQAWRGWYAYGVSNGLTHEQATRFAEKKINENKGVQTPQTVI